MLKDVAAEYQPQFPYDILLASVNGKLQELHKTVKDGTEICFLTALDKPGRCLPEKCGAFDAEGIYEVAGADRIRKLTVDFSLGGGLFVEPEVDFVLTEELLEQVKARMLELADEQIPIMKRSSQYG